MQYIDIDSDKIKKARDIHYKFLYYIIMKKIDGPQFKGKEPKDMNQININNKVSKSVKDFIRKNIETILIGNPEELLELHNQAQAQNLSEREIEKLINYDEWIKKDEEEGTYRKYNAYDLAENLDIPTCTYCNRMYTKTVIVNKIKLTRPQFDHWFPKSKYPLLQLSFYNLIPSCSICNSGLKGATALNLQEHFHPYVKPTDDFKYAYSYDYKKDLNHFEFKIKTENDKAKNTSNAFQLKDIYDTHVDELQDLLRIKETYSESYIHMLSTMTSLNLDKEEIYRLAFGVHYEDALHDRRPLSKMKKDILIELGIMKVEDKKKQENKTTNSPPTSDNKDEGSLENSKQSSSPDDKAKGEEKN